MNRVAEFVFAAALSLAIASPAAAQDEIVPANKEPRHLPKLENEWVRIIDVEIPEGEQSMYHTHSFDYPYVLITSVTLYNQIYRQEPTHVKMEAGFIGYHRASAQGAYTTRGPGPCHGIGICGRAAAGRDRRGNRARQ